MSGLSKLPFKMRESRWACGASIEGIPEQHLVQEFSAHRPNQALDERVGQRHMRDGFDFVDLQNSQVRPSPVRLEQRIVIRAETSRYALAVNRDVKHPAHVGTCDGAVMDADGDEPTRELVHNYQHPVAPEHDRLAAKEVHTPEAVSGVADKRQPRGPGSARRRALVFREHAVHDGPVDVEPERLRDDAGNPWTAEPRIARLEFDDDVDECLVRPCRSWFLGARRRREQPAVLRPTSAR
jgi:hypothetical protein